jgi:hypothetical protein
MSVLAALREIWHGDEDFYRMYSILVTENLVTLCYFGMCPTLDSFDDRFTGHFIVFK